MQIGDFILVHRRGVLPGLIRLAQRLRFSRVYSYWNHAALYDGDGWLIEAKEFHRVRRLRLTDYGGIDYVVVRVDCLDFAMRQNASRFANSQIGAGYGYVTILSLIGWIFTGGRLTIGLNGTDICSGLVARATERMGVIYRRDPETIMPADLAYHFKVTPKP